MQSFFLELDWICEEISHFSRSYHLFELDLNKTLAPLKRSNPENQKLLQLFKNEYRCICSNLKKKIQELTGTYVTLERYYLVFIIQTFLLIIE